MEWNSIKIRDLRRRLGWSQSDLARHLNCECEQVKSLETGGLSPAGKQLHALELLEKQAESRADELLQDPLAEKFLDENHLDQIDLASVKKRFSQNN